MTSRRTRCRRHERPKTLPARERRIAEPVYGFKILIEAKGGRILGAQLVGPVAEEVINVFALAIGQGMTAEELKQAVIFADPTGASDIGSMR